MSGRGLAPAEEALLAQAFGAAVPYARVRLVQGHSSNPAAVAAFRSGAGAITLRRSIYFAPSDYRDDFAAAGPGAQGLLVHEVTHVWQYARLGVAAFLIRYARELARSGMQPAKMYVYEEGVTPFAAATLEAQAQMAGDYWFAIATGNAARARRLEANLRGSGLFVL